MTMRRRSSFPTLDEGLYGHFGPKTLRHLYLVPKCPGHFGTEMSQDTSGRCGRPTAGESDSDVSMRTHVFRTLSSCFATLRQLRSIRRSTSQAVLLSLVVSLVLSRLDYGYATLAGLPNNQIDRLVCDERRCTTCLLCAEARTHHPATP